MLWLKVWLVYSRIQAEMVLIPSALHVDGHGHSYLPLWSKPISYLLFHVSVKELHREFLRAGSDVMQTFTFYASDDKLGNRGNKAAEIGVQFVYLYVKLVNLEGDIEQWFCYK